MEFLRIPEVQRLHGEQAITALQNLILELEHNKESALTRKQKRVLIKISGSLITSIKAEMQSNKGKKTAQTFSEQDPFAVFRRIFPWIPH